MPTSCRRNRELRHLPPCLYLPPSGLTLSSNAWNSLLDCSFTLASSAILGPGKMKTPSGPSGHPRRSPPQSIKGPDFSAKCLPLDQSLDRRAAHGLCATCSRSHLIWFSDSAPPSLPMRVERRPTLLPKHQVWALALRALHVDPHAFRICVL